MVLAFYEVLSGHLWTFAFISAGVIDDNWRAECADELFVSGSTGTPVKGFRNS